MRVHYVLSGKSATDGRREVLVYVQPFVNGRVMTMRAGSGVMVSEKFFDARAGVKDLTRRKTIDGEADYHRQAGDKLRRLTAAIEESAAATGRGRMKGDWLQKVIDKYYNIEEEEELPSFYELAERFLQKPLSEGYRKSFRCMLRDMARFERYVRVADRRRREWFFDVTTARKEDIKAFRYFLLNEREVMRRYPKLYEKRAARDAEQAGRHETNARGGNTVVSIMKRLKTFCLWCVKEGITTNRPFDGVEVGGAVSGEPIYITVAERRKIAAAELPTEHLRRQRDIFVFQCLTGCRVGDLERLTAANITGKIMTYVPHKTAARNATPVRVPLVAEAAELARRYEGADVSGRLFPFISPQKYNEAIKAIFLYAGITRMVSVRNALTGAAEMRPINEVASSHMARRTFVGNLYFEVQDPALIGRMSGHTATSSAFRRYRKIEDSTLAEVVEKLR